VRWCSRISRVAMPLGNVLCRSRRSFAESCSLRRFGFFIPELSAISVNREAGTIGFKECVCALIPCVFVSGFNSFQLLASCDAIADQ